MLNLRKLIRDIFKMEKQTNLFTKHHFTTKKTHLRTLKIHV